MNFLTFLKSDIEVDIRTLSYKRYCIVSKDRRTKLLDVTEESHSGDTVTVRRDIVVRYGNMNKQVIKIVVS
jgi:hypothetical protein